MMNSWRTHPVIVAWFEACQAKGYCTPDDVEMLRETLGLPKYQMHDLFTKVMHPEMRENGIKYRNRKLSSGKYPPRAVELLPGLTTPLSLPSCVRRSSAMRQSDQRTEPSTKHPMPVLRIVSIVLFLVVVGVIAAPNFISPISDSTGSSDSFADDPYSPDNPDYSTSGRTPGAAADVEAATQDQIYAALKAKMAATELNPNEYSDDAAWNAAQDRVDNQVFQETADEFGVTFREAEDIWLNHELQ